MIMIHALADLIRWYTELYSGFHLDIDSRAGKILDLRNKGWRGQAVTTCYCMRQPLPGKFGFFVLKKKMFRLTVLLCFE